MFKPNKNRVFAIILSYPVTLSAFAHTEWASILPYQNDKTGLLPVPPLSSCPSDTVVCSSSGSPPQSLSFYPTSAPEPYSRYDMVDSKSGLMKPVYYMSSTNYRKSLDADASKLLNDCLPQWVNTQSPLADLDQLMVKPDLLVTTERKTETIIITRDLVHGWQVLRIPGITIRDDVPSLFELKDGLALSININQGQIVTTFNAEEAMIDGIIITSTGLVKCVKNNVTDQEPVDSGKTKAQKGAGKSPQQQKVSAAVRTGKKEKEKQKLNPGGGGGGSRKPDKTETFPETSIQYLETRNIDEMIQGLDRSRTKRPTEALIREIISKQRDADAGSKIGAKKQQKIFQILNDKQSQGLDPDLMKRLKDCFNP